MEKINFKALSLVSILSLLYFCVDIITLVDLITIMEYQKFCTEYLYQEITIEKSRLAFGMITTTFGENELVLPTAFYENSIKDRTNITLFLEKISWSILITENQFNFEKVSEIVLKQYQDYVCNMEKIDNIFNLTDDKIIDSKLNARKILYNFISTLTLSYEEKELFLSSRFLEHIISIISWSDYMKTIDFKSGEFLRLKDFCLDEILILRQKLSCDLEAMLAEKYRFLDVIIYTVIMKILLQGLGLFLWNNFPIETTVTAVLDMIFNSAQVYDILKYFSEIVTVHIALKYNLEITETLAQQLAYRFIFKIGITNAAKIYLESITFDAWISKID